MPSPKPCCERDHDRDGNCDRRPPSELPAVQAEVVETKRPEALPFVDQWAVQELHFNGVSHLLIPCSTEHSARELSEFMTKQKVAHRLIRIPGEQAPSAPTKFPMCAVHSFVTTDVCGCARRDVPSAPTQGGESLSKELYSLAYEIDVLVSAAEHGDPPPTGNVGIIRAVLARLQAHYAHPKCRDCRHCGAALSGNSYDGWACACGKDPETITHPKPTGMTREVEELVAMCEKMADDPLRMVDQISLREKIAAVRAAGGGA